MSQRSKPKVGHKLAHTDELAKRLPHLIAEYARDPKVKMQHGGISDPVALTTGCVTWYAKGAEHMAQDILGLLGDWPSKLEILQEDDFDEDERLKGLCRYAQELDAERLEILIAIRVIQEERATRKFQKKLYGGGRSDASAKRHRTRTSRHKR